MNTSTRDDILQLINDRAPIGATQIAQDIGISTEMTHRHLKKLLKEQKITKQGTPPRVFYFPPKDSFSDSIAIKDTIKEQIIRREQKPMLEKHFYTITVDGREQQGVSGFLERCNNRHLNAEKASKQFQKIITQIETQKDRLGLLNITPRFQKQFEHVYMQKLRVIQPYQLQQFGKSKLGTLAFYAKQSQSEKLTKHVIEATKNKVNQLIQTYKIDTICYAPPSLRRQVQLMDELKKAYQTGLPEIILTKIFHTDIIIPQKSLKGTKQRVENANKTIYVDPKITQPTATNLLIIDDFIGSGATINICAKKIKEKKLAKKIYGLALVGNIDLSYEVISEV